MSIAEIRREQHLRWRRSELIKKKPLFDRWLVFNSTPIELAAYRITRVARRHLLAPPINVSSEEWLSIPPIYRVRIKVTTESLYPHPSLDDRPKKKSRSTPPIPQPSAPPPMKPSISTGSFDEEIQRVLEESLAHQQKVPPTTENGSRIGSLVSNITSYFVPTEESEPVPIEVPVGGPASPAAETVSAAGDDGSIEDEFDEDQLLAAAIEASMNAPPPTGPKPVVDTDSPSDGMELASQLLTEVVVADRAPTPIEPEPMVFGFDLRLIRHQLEQPFEFAGLHYFLTLPQKMYLHRLWTKVDPATTVGTHFRQDIEYYKSEAIDLAKKKKFLYDDA